MIQALAHHPLAERFKKLDPHQVLDRVDEAGFVSTGRILPLNSYENRVYQVETERAHDLVVKFYRPGRWSIDAVEEEHDFIYELDEAAIPVALPLELTDGFTVGTLTGDAEGIHYCLYRRLAGRVNDEPTEDDLRDLGAYIARIHDVGEGQDAPNRGVLSVETYGWKSLELLESSDKTPERWKAPYRNVVGPILDRIQPLLDAVEIHRIHGDCHHGNLLWNRDGPVFFDFDDFCIGPAVQDIWLLAPDPGEEGRRRRLIIADGYRRCRPFDHHWMRLVEPLRALRMIRYAAWIASRWYDPVFQKVFAHFGTDRWWGEEIIALREQFARIEEELSV